MAAVRLDELMKTLKYERLESAKSYRSCEQSRFVNAMKIMGQAKKRADKECGLVNGTANYGG